MNKKTIILLSAVVLVVGGFTANMVYQLGKLKDITYKLIGGSVKLLTKEKVILNLAVEVDNPSDIDAYIYNYDMEVFLNGTIAGLVKYDKEQYLKANGKTNIILSVHIAMKQYFNIGEIIEYLSYFISDKSKLNIEVKGAIKVKHNMFPARIPVDIIFNLAELN